VLTGFASRGMESIATPIVLAAIVGCVGGIYGIGGRSILAPILIGPGRRASEVAPAALASTFVTSVAGVITFMILPVHHHGSVAPSQPTGIALGIGGLAGGCTGARIQSRLPDVLIRHLAGVLVIAIGARYLMARAGITGPATRSAGESITHLATHHAGKRQRPLD
jgi:uncharacterized protein